MSNLKQQVLQNMNLTPREEKFLIFRLKCILYDSSKMIMFLIFFGCIHKLDLFVFAYIAILPLRLISGGLHFKHYLSCLFFSFGYFAVLTILLVHIEPPIMVLVPVLTVCTAIIYAIGPIRAPSRPPMSADEISKSRKKSLLAIAYIILLTAIVSKTRFAAIGYWAVILHTTQLTIAYLRKSIIKKGGDTHA